MEGIIVFIYLIVIVFGILQIILFFKIWGMTSNVKRIVKKINEKDYLANACLSYVKGNIDETEKMLNEGFLAETSLLSKNAESYEEWREGFAELKWKYEKAFKKINRPTPDFDKYKDSNNYLL